MSFTQSAVLFSLLIWQVFLLFLFFLPRHPKFCLGLPRHRELGAALALVCLLWSAWHVALMLEGDMARYQWLLIFWLWEKWPVPVPGPLVFLVAALAYYFLSFLFARAFGGFLLLCLVWLLHAAFTVALPGRPLFSAIVYLIALVGALLVAMPWLMRDAFERALASTSFRHCLATALAILATVFLIFGLLA